MRLTSDLRQKITGILIKDRFDERLKSAEKAVNLAGMQAYFAEIGKEHFDMIRQLPAKYLQQYTKAHMRVFGGKDIYVSFDRPVVLYVLNPPEPERTALIAADDELSKVKNEIYKAQDEIRAVLLSVTTVKKLREIWPEAAAAIDKALGTTSVGPKFELAPILTNLNKTLGLP